MSADYERGLPPEQAVFQLRDATKRIALGELYQLLNIQTIVRITESPSNLSRKHSIVGHIGLPVTETQGMKVLIARIHKPGHFNQSESKGKPKEVLPVLVLSSACLGTIDMVIQQNTFDDLPAEAFERYVIGGIRRDNILPSLERRYRQSHGFTTNEIIERGYSYRGISLDGKLKKSEIRDIWCKIPSVDAE